MSIQYTPMFIRIARKLHSQISIAVVLVAIAANESDGQIVSTFTRPAQELSVATSENGVIMEKLVEEGQAVTQGQILAKLNNTTLVEAKRLATVRAQSVVKIRAAEANLAMRQSHWESLKDLLDKGHGNQREVDVAKLQLEAAQADLDLAKEQREESAIELARIDAELEQRVIRSPINGIIATIHKETGEYIASNDPVLCTIIRNDYLRADFYLDLGTLVKVQRAMKDGNFSLPVKIRTEPENARESREVREIIVESNVIYISPTLDPKSETGRVTVEISNPDRRLVSGCRCILLLDATSDIRDKVGSIYRSPQPSVDVTK